MCKCFRIVKQSMEPTTATDMHWYHTGSAEIDEMIDMAMVEEADAPQDDRHAAMRDAATDLHEVRLDKEPIMDLVAFLLVDSMVVEECNGIIGFMGDLLHQARRGRISVHEPDMYALEWRRVPIFLHWLFLRDDNEYLKLANSASDCLRAPAVRDTMVLFRSTFMCPSAHRIALNIQTANKQNGCWQWLRGQHRYWAGMWTWEQLCTCFNGDSSLFCHKVEAFCGMFLRAVSKVISLAHCAAMEANADTRGGLFGATKFFHWNGAVIFYEGASVDPEHMLLQPHLMMPHAWNVCYKVCVNTPKQDLHFTQYFYCECCRELLEVRNPGPLTCYQQQVCTPSPVDILISDLEETFGFKEHGMKAFGQSEKFIHRLKSWEKSGDVVPIQIKDRVFMYTVPPGYPPGAHVVINAIAEKSQQPSKRRKIVDIQKLAPLIEEV